MGVSIIYENENVLVINKPSGLVVHPSSTQGRSNGKTEEQTLCDWAVSHYPEMKEVGEPLVLASGKEILRPGIVHRLDKETSGVLLLAKNQATYLYVKNQFKNRLVEKRYNAFLYGELKEDSGIIDRPIARSTKDFRLRSAQPGARGEHREAVTEFTVIKRGKGFTYVEAQPKTGRTHQLRTHFKALHHPIVCDKLYAPKRVCELGFERLALHARLLVIEVSKTTTLKIEAPLPDDFKHALRELEK